MAETARRGLKYTTIEELEKQDKGPVWVLNNTRDNLEGKVVVSIPKRNGNGADVIRVPRSFIPFDLTLQVPRPQLLDSADFRQTVGKKFLRLITPEYATVLLATEEARDEQVRLRNEASKAEAALKKAGVVDPNASGGVGEDDEDEFFDTDGGPAKASKKKKSMATAKEATEPTKAPRVASVKVQSIVATAKREEMTEVQILAKLRNVSKFRKADLAYLSKEYSDRPKIMKFLKEVLAKLKAAAAATA